MNTQTIVSIVAAIVSIIGTYHIFKKANVEGWKAIIPFYNDYTEYKLVWNTEMFWVYITCLVVAIACTGVATALMKTAVIVALILTVVALNAAIVTVVLFVQESYKLSKKFGHGKGYTAGLVFLSPIFRMALGFDQSQYQAA